jgi:DNA-binding transcriptional MocR family regulator
VKLYETLAADLAAMIDSGALRPGERLPSVRQLRERRQLSASTVFHALYQLEARGLIVARPRSGYFVAPRRAHAALEPELSAPPMDAQDVDSSDLIFNILGAACDRAIVPFGSAFPNPELFPLAALSRAIAGEMRQLDPWSTVADLTPGNAELRRFIARRYQQDGADVGADDVVITNGALEALTLCLQAVTRPGDTVLVESPTFYATLQALERLGLRAAEVPTHPRDGVDIDALAAAIARHRPAAAWLMTSFQNPLGSTVPDQRRRQLVDLLAHAQVPLVEDDVYAELYFGRRPLLTKSLDRDGLVLHCGSFSKCLAPGYRIGWAVPGRHTRTVQKLKLASSLGAPLPSQLALAAYLGKGTYEKHLRQLRHALAGQRDAMLDGVARYFPAGTRVARPEGGYFLWVELPQECDALALHRAALEQGIGIAPGPIFSASGGFHHCIRLNYGQGWTTRHQAALQAVGALASSFQCR